MYKVHLRTRNYLNYSSVTVRGGVILQSFGLLTAKYYDYS